MLCLFYGDNDMSSLLKFLLICLRAVSLMLVRWWDYFATGDIIPKDRDKLDCFKITNKQTCG